MRWDVAAGDEQLRAAVAAVFDSATPENALKLDALRPARDEFRFDAADAFVDWAGGAGLAVRGHTLVWHQQLPAWLRERDWTEAELENVLVEHVTTVVRRYRGRIDTWDVVNEPFDDDGGWRTERGSPWLPVLGPRYAEIALRAARAADPGARLLVNEIGAEHGGPKLDALVRMAEDYLRRGVPLDGIGLQGHLTVRDPPARQQLRRSIERIADLGLDVEITELDVMAPGGAPERQAEVYGDVGAACAAVARCRRVTVWGMSDRDHWLGADRRAAPFDAQLRPKPAWEALTAGLR